MVLWHCNLRPARVLLRLSWLLHGILFVALGWAASSVTWSELPGVGLYLLLSGLVLEMVLTQRRLQAQQGELQLTTSGTLIWQGRYYAISGRPLLLNFVLVIPVRACDDSNRQRLWLARECLSQQQWRAVRQYMLQW